jgi:hypothetical protein
LQECWYANLKMNANMIKPPSNEASINGGSFQEGFAGWWNWFRRRGGTVSSGTRVKGAI